MGKELTSGKLAELVNGELVGDGNVVLDGVESLGFSTSTQASFLAVDKYAEQVAASNAGAIIVPENFEGSPNAGQAFIKSKDSNLAFGVVVDFFAPAPVEFPPGVHPKAYVADSAQIGEGVHIGANAVVEENAVIGAGTVIVGGAYIGHEVAVGENTLIYSNVSVRDRCKIGNRVIIHPGAVIGADGFGFAPGPRGIVKVPQVGIVQIDDDVEIGANAAVDRARFGRTWIKQGVKIDNLVQIGHNVEIGAWTMICGQVGIAGSTTIGSGVIMAGQSGSNGHITIGDGATIGGMSGVVNDVTPGDTLVGFPAETKREFATRVGLPRKVKKLADQIKQLKTELAELKKS